MQTESKRVFVPNLPEDLTEEDVRHRFFKFGDITSIEIKHRKDLNARNHSHKYAFINIDTNHQLLQQCFDEFTKKKWSGNYVDVQLAKESFLERLKKEREDAQKQEKPANKTNGKASDEKVLEFNNDVVNSKHSNRKRFSTEENDEEACLPKKSKVEVASTQSIKSSKSSVKSKKQVQPVEVEESDDDGSEVDSDKDFVLAQPICSDLIVKSNKHKVMTNKIEGVGLPPIHIQTREVKRKSKDPYREQADQKRINSMLKIRQGYMQQKSLIKNALSNIDGQKSKKIVFNDDGENDLASEGPSRTDEVTATKKSTNQLDKKSKKDLNENEKFVLFDGDDDDNDTMVDENSFKLREEYEGKKGKKLFEMQTRFNQDERFKMDARFAEGDSTDAEDCIDDDKTPNGVDELQTEERAMQMQVLGEVLKKPLTATATKSRKSMLRFDPSQPEHSKYEIPARNDSTKTKKGKDKDKKDAPEEEKLPEVSADTFYEVTEKIPFQESGSGEMFSFLKAFGRNRGDDAGEGNDTQNASENDTNDNVDSDAEKEVAAASTGAERKKMKKSTSGENAFKYDSSDDEDDNDKEVNIRAQDVEKAGEKEKSVSLGRGQLWTEPFFFKKDDYRLQEGVDFVKRMFGMDDDADFSKTRQDLKKIVKRKVATYQKKKQMFKKKLGSSANKRRNRVTKALHRNSR